MNYDPQNSDLSSNRGSKERIKIPKIKACSKKLSEKYTTLNSFVGKTPENKNAFQTKKSKGGYRNSGSFFQAATHNNNKKRQQEKKKEILENQLDNFLFKKQRNILDIVTSLKETSKIIEEERKNKTMVNIFKNTAKKPFCKTKNFFFDNETINYTKTNLDTLSNVKKLAQSFDIADRSNIYNSYDYNYDERIKKSDLFETFDLENNPYDQANFDDNLCTSLKNSPRICKKVKNLQSDLSNILEATDFLEENGMENYKESTDLKQRMNQYVSKKMNNTQEDNKQPFKSSFSNHRRKNFNVTTNHSFNKSLNQSFVNNKKKNPYLENSIYDVVDNLENLDMTKYMTRETGNLWTDKFVQCKAECLDKQNEAKKKASKSFDNTNIQDLNAQHTSKYNAIKNSSHYEKYKTNMLDLKTLKAGFPGRPDKINKFDKLTGKSGKSVELMIRNNALKQVQQKEQELALENRRREKAYKKGDQFNTGKLNLQKKTEFFIEHGSCMNNNDFKFFSQRAKVFLKNQKNNNNKTKGSKKTNDSPMLKNIGDESDWTVEEESMWVPNEDGNGFHFEKSKRKTLKKRLHKNKIPEEDYISLSSYVVKEQNNSEVDSYNHSENVNAFQDYNESTSTYVSYDENNRPTRTFSQNDQKEKIYQIAQKYDLSKLFTDNAKSKPELEKSKVVKEDIIKSNRAIIRKNTFKRNVPSGNTQKLPRMSLNKVQVSSKEIPNDTVQQSPRHGHKITEAKNPGNIKHTSIDAIVIASKFQRPRRKEKSTRITVKNINLRSDYIFAEKKPRMLQGYLFGQKKCHNDDHKDLLFNDDDASIEFVEKLKDDDEKEEEKFDCFKSNLNELLTMTANNFLAPWMIDKDQHTEIRDDQHLKLIDSSIESLEKKAVGVLKDSRHNTKHNTNNNINSPGKLKGERVESSFEPIQVDPLGVQKPKKMYSEVDDLVFEGTVEPKRFKAQWKQLLKSTPDEAPFFHPEIMRRRKKENYYEKLRTEQEDVIKKYSENIFIKTATNFINRLDEKDQNNRRLKDFNDLVQAFNRRGQNGDNIKNRRRIPSLNNKPRFKKFSLKKIDNIVLAGKESPGKKDSIELSVQDDNNSSVNEAKGKKLKVKDRMINVYF